jgi:hypothetical protein
MSRWLHLLFAATAIALPFGLCAPASADGGYKACKVGDRVADSSGHSGTVVSIEANGTYCHVDLGNGDKDHYFIFWMLHPAGKPMVDPAQVARILPGRYACYAGLPLQYTFSDIIVKSPSAYTDNKGNAGAFSYVPSTQLITFRSGTFQGMYAKYLEGHSIGVASKPTTFFATVCSLQR